MNQSSSFWRWVVGGILFSAMVLAGYPSAHADEAGPLSLGGRAVYFVPKGGDGVWEGGAQARLRLPLFFGIEGSADYRRETLGSTTIHDWPLQASALLYLPKIILVQPFILGGVGWYHTTVEGPNGFNDTQTRTGPHAGAGVEVNLDSHWFLDASYRYIWLKDIHVTDASGTEQDLEDHSHMITAGLNYRF